jgi:hypothetical protein
MMRSLMVVAALCAMARADNAVPGEAAGPSPRCDWQAAPYFRDRERSVKRIDEQGQMWFVQRSEHFVLLAGSRWERPTRSRVINHDSTRMIAEIPVETAAIVEAPDGNAYRS